MEKAGASSVRLSKCNKLKNIMDKCSFYNMGFKGPKFTWERGMVYERLDKGICNVSWGLKFPESTIHHLPRIKSDHRPIMLRI
ncbi:conserved hypothetical protein [Ricinus communis]|uniref:Endonuclease/exonuclease/phosphatase domain-containing protein n=1 Tax=Ricinus communis TaxID=3988 RepID=B9SDS4_RICCO|nr:conserved hypothetical protein [Ricinus communis]